MTIVKCKHPFDVFDEPMATILLCRSGILMDIADKVKANELSHNDVAEILGINKKRVLEMLRGCLTRFETDELLSYKAKLSSIK